jgi:DNA-binding NtrC family response regulator
MSRILIADDEHAICQAFARLVQLAGHEALIASNGRQALALVREASPDLVFLDIQMPGMSGLQVLEAIQAESPGLPVVVMTAYGTMQTALEAIRLGAFDYVGKPMELDRIREVVARALQRERPRAQAATLQAPQVRPALIGRSAVMQEIFKLMVLLTNNELTVLVTGESGVGKELVARGIHDNGPRAGSPFVAVNCAAIPAQLIETELFGHEKGAFTGAGERRVGRIEAAAGGTLFLDEIGELSPALQAKLLRMLQERTFERLGSVQPQPVRARIIAATNRQLEGEVAAGRFREDLFYRLNLVRLEIPPLRRRREDIPALTEHFLAVANHELGKSLNAVEPDALELLQRHSWPGNVRELENLVTRAALKARGSTLTRHDIDLPTTSDEAACGIDEWQSELVATARRTLLRRQTAEFGAETRPFHDIVSLVETTLVDEALRLTAGNQVAAARLLGINRTTLRKKAGIRDETD